MDKCCIPHNHRTTLQKRGDVRTEWNAGAISQQNFYNDGWVEFKFLDYKYAIMGLAVHNTSVSPATINYGIYAHINGYLYIYENGIQLSNVGKGLPIHPQYSATDVLRVERSNGVVYYKKNGVVFYTSTIPSSGPLHADCSFLLANATISVTNFMFGLVWTGAQNQDWNEPGNWSLNRVPTSNDQVIINMCSNCPKLSTSVSVGMLQLNSGSVIDLDNHNLSAGAVIINGSTVESSQGHIRSEDFLEIKSSLFKGSITLDKTGGGANNCYGANTFSSEVKVINASNNVWQVATQADNVIENF
jgi:hypothetical protein